jgi:hypothetical protein
MLRNILVYGFIAGAIAIGLMTIDMVAGIHSLAIGYLILFAALSLIFVSIKRYRDEALGGIIRFGTALKLGLGISLIASFVYVVGWEIYLWSTDYSFLEDYLAADLEARRAAGASAAELAQLRGEMAELAAQYNSQPLLRFAFTLAEILPVGLVVTFLSALLLRNSRFLAARGQPGRDDAATSTAESL